MICPECGESFEARAVNQRFCSARRREKHWRIHGYQRRESITFLCANPKCRKMVVTETNRPDKRTRFCSRECEKAYWRHPPKDSDIRNFSGMDSYRSYEQKSSAW